IARLSDFFCRDGRGARWPVHASGRLRITLPTMGNGTAQSRSEAHLGGPVFQGVNEDIQVWPDAKGRTSWLGRFVDYLKARNRLSDLAFMSFEHYPFEPCKIAWSTLYEEPERISHIMQVWRDAGVPANVPFYISEL